MPVSTRSQSISSPRQQISFSRGWQDSQISLGTAAQWRPQKYFQTLKRRYTDIKDRNPHKNVEVPAMALRSSHESVNLLNPTSSKPAAMQSKIKGAAGKPEERIRVPQAELVPQCLGTYNWAAREDRDRNFLKGKENEMCTRASARAKASQSVVAKRTGFVMPRTLDYCQTEPSGANTMLGSAFVDEISLDGSGQSSRIMVYVRLRPMSKKEKETGCQSCVRVLNNRDVFLTELASETDYLRLKRLKGRHFTFDAAFPENAGQEEVYNTSAAKLVDGVLQGRNCSVFCYGATGAGKTYTMLGTVQSPGVMVLALTDLFYKLQMQSKNDDYVVRLSYLEVYNETVRDLLSPGRPLVLREDNKQGIVAAGLTQYEAHSADEVMALLQKGNQNRQTEPTRINETSSRSHAILQVVAEYNFSQGASCMTRVGKLSLIDLAGSERALATDQRTLRSLEGANINRSLLALSSCINALVEGKKHIPFRNSKLTQLLKDSLGGACQTAMIANISPGNSSFGETQNTLHWADRAKEIRTKTCTKEELQIPECYQDQTKLLLQMQKENQDLKLQLAKLQQKYLSSSLSDIPILKSPREDAIRLSAPALIVPSPTFSDHSEDLCQSSVDVDDPQKTIQELKKTIRSLENEAESRKKDKHDDNVVAGYTKKITDKNQVSVNLLCSKSLIGTRSTAKKVVDEAEEGAPASKRTRALATPRVKEKITVVPGAGKGFPKMSEQRMKTDRLRRFSEVQPVPSKTQVLATPVLDCIKSAGKKRRYSELGNITSNTGRCTRRNTATPSMLLQPGFARRGPF